MEVVPLRLKPKSEDNGCGDPSAQALQDSLVWFFLHLNIMTQMKISKTWINDAQRQDQQDMTKKHVHSWSEVSHLKNLRTPLSVHSPTKKGSQVGNDDVGKNPRTRQA